MSLIGPCLLRCYLKKPLCKNDTEELCRATREIKRLCPGSKISGGVSNIAFSFRGNEPVRRSFHSAFLHHACAVRDAHAWASRQLRP